MPWESSAVGAVEVEVSLHCPLLTLKHLPEQQQSRMKSQPVVQGPAALLDSWEFFTARSFEYLQREKLSLLGRRKTSVL